MWSIILMKERFLCSDQRSGSADMQGHKGKEGNRTVPKQGETNEEGNDTGYCG